MRSGWRANWSPRSGSKRSVRICSAKTRLSSSTMASSMPLGRHRARSLVGVVETCDFMAGSDDFGTYHQTGIRAVQSTPLLSRGGHVLGMISTHWRQPHCPSERDLRLLDVLARQAADLIERSLAERRTKVLLREVSHRAKNILAVAQAMARQTAGEEDAMTFAQQFSARLEGLAASQELLLESDWCGVEASELVRSQLSHMGTSSARASRSRAHRCGLPRPLPKPSAWPYTSCRPTPSNTA